MIKVLNLYCGIGGNRKLWSNVEVTAVEKEVGIANVYKDFFPNDEVVIGDAHEFLLANFKKYDFIWSSPPCQTHARMRKELAVRFRGTPPVYPDLTLYQEILFLKSHFEGKFVVENVIPYYKPLIDPTVKLQRHFFWSNFPIREHKFPTDQLSVVTVPELQRNLGIDISKYHFKNREQVLRNCTKPEIGDYILREAFD